MGFKRSKKEGGMLEFKGNEDSIKSHLRSFYDTVQYEQKNNPEVHICSIIDRYVKSQVECENGMADYFNFLKEVDRHNERLLRAIKSLRGKTFYKHLKSFILDSEPAEHHKWEIVKEPQGKERTENEYGRSIRKYWSWQVSQGMEGDSWWGAIYIEIKNGKYLKYHFSM